MTRFLLVISSIWTICLLADVSHALPPFKKAFTKRYVKKIEDDVVQKSFKKAGCNICHIKGQKDKAPQNAYGEALNALIPGDAKDRLEKAKEDGNKPEVQKEILDQLEKAFDKVEQEKAPEGDTFGARISQGLLPVSLPESDK